jgi:hypothetical protein
MASQIRAGEYSADAHKPQGLLHVSQQMCHDDELRDGGSRQAAAPSEQAVDSYRLR